MLDEQHTGCCTMPQSDYILGSTMKVPAPPPREGGWVLGLIFAGYVPLASQSPNPIIVYSLANYRPHLSHF